MGAASLHSQARRNPDNTQHNMKVYPLILLVIAAACAISVAGGAALDDADVVTSNVNDIRVDTDTVAADDTAAAKVEDRAWKTCQDCVNYCEGWRNTCYIFKCQFGGWCG